MKVIELIFSLGSCRLNDLNNVFQAFSFWHVKDLQDAKVPGKDCQGFKQFLRALKQRNLSDMRKQLSEFNRIILSEAARTFNNFRDLRYNRFCKVKEKLARALDMFASEIVE